MAHLFKNFIGDSLHTHFGKDAFASLAKYWSLDPAIFSPMLYGAAILLVLWIILLWMYWRRIFIRI
jgi:hypothetical protein